MHLVEMGLYSFITFYTVFVGKHWNIQGFHGNSWESYGTSWANFHRGGEIPAHRPHGGSLEDSVKAVVDTMLPDYASKLIIFAGDVPWPGGWEQVMEFVALFIPFLW